MTHVQILSREILREILVLKLIFSFSAPSADALCATDSGARSVGVQLAVPAFSILVLIGEFRRVRGGASARCLADRFRHSSFQL